MNADHQLALIDYVVVYGDIKPTNIIDESVKIVSVDEKQLVLEYDVIKPPITKTLSLYWHDAKEDENIEVNSFSDIKGKLIAMAKYCAKEQGYAIKKLTKIYGPRLSQLPMYLFWISLFLNAYDPNILTRLVANDAVFNKVVGYLPSAVIAGYKNTETHAIKYITGLFVTHLAEILLFTKGYLQKYRVPENQRWVWYLMHLFEGYPVIFRLRRVTK
ncbi:hypothetical protein SBY92_004155 [Candida maltosa Xu316]